MTAVEMTLVAALGLAVGSFLNVVVHRLPRQESLVSPGSRCPACGSMLRWFDNVPVLSYAFLGGRCRGCRGVINVRYPLVELITAAVFLGHYAAFGWTPLLAVRLLFAASLVALFVIDLEHHLLPDAITLPGIAAGLLASVFVPPGFTDALIGALIGGGVLWGIGEAYFRYAGEEGMGGGDVKMLAMIGAFLGWKLVLVTLVLSSVAGSLLGLGLIVVHRGGLKKALPFGTFLALGALAASLYGDQIVTWYAGRL
ncbi:MAG: prepilin peptidase [Acidobacteria bacterium]|nr:prepilin peptidase [Acidobacteriota bacterium]